jgi:hypothetical protein
MKISEIPVSEKRGQSETAKNTGKGKGTIKAPFPSNPDLRVWIRRLPMSELDGLILVNNMILSPQGYLSKDSIGIATKLSISFGSYETIEDDEEEHLQSLRQANAWRGLHTLNVLYVHVHNVQYASHRSKT